MHDREQEGWRLAERIALRKEAKQLAEENIALRRRVKELERVDERLTALENKILILEAAKEDYEDALQTIRAWHRSKP